jgi:hypothetical protein
MLYRDGCVFIILIAQVKESHDGLRTNGKRVIQSCDVSITIMLCGGGCFFIVLIAQVKKSSHMTV